MTVVRQVLDASSINCYMFYLWCFVLKPALPLINEREINHDN